MNTNVTDNVVDSRTLICNSTKEEQNNEQKSRSVEIEEDTDTYRFVDQLL